LEAEKKKKPVLYSIGSCPVFQYFLYPNFYGTSSVRNVLSDVLVILSEPCRVYKEGLGPRFYIVDSSSIHTFPL
jgi:hypothetical protein